MPGFPPRELAPGFWLRANKQRRQRIEGRLHRLASQNRARPTQAEYLLWEALKYGACGPCWFQKPILYSYIADFFFPRAQLVVEVDGGYHNHPDQQRRDARRDHHMRVAEQYSVLHFTNDEVIADTKAVVARIARRIRSLTAIKKREKLNAWRAVKRRQA